MTKKEMQLLKIEFMMSFGEKNGLIKPFDEELYNQMKNTYIAGLPVDFHIKHLRPRVTSGKCYDRSLYMFYALKDAVLVRGNIKTNELLYGEQGAGHGWIEIDNYVYDPDTLQRIDKRLYYKANKPTDVMKTTKEEYCSDIESKKLYDMVKNTTIDDYKPHGSKRTDLLTTIPILLEISIRTTDEEFKDDLYDYLRKISYDEIEIENELLAKQGKLLNRKKLK